MWASYSGSSDLYIWNTKDFTSTPQKIHLQDCSEITCMIQVKNQVGDIWTVLTRGILVEGKFRSLDI